MNTNPKENCVCNFVFCTNNLGEKMGSLKSIGWQYFYNKAKNSKLEERQLRASRIHDGDILVPLLYEQGEGKCLLSF